MTEEVYQKQCSGCKEIKSFDSFGKDTSRRDGKCYYCKECRSQIIRTGTGCCACGQPLSKKSKGRCRLCCLTPHTETHKRCSQCKEFRLFENFYKRTNNSDGLSSECRECRSAKRNIERRESVACVKCGILREICADGAWKKRLCRKCGSTRVRTLPLKYCRDCGKRITPYASQCYKCRGQSRSGANHFWWKGGISTPEQLERTGWLITKWRKAVFFRDGYECQICFEKGHRDNPLHAHHKKGWVQFPDMRYEVANGITLCRDCHLYVAHQGAWRNDPIEL